MSLMKKHINNKVKKNKELSADEEVILALFEKPSDFTEKKNINKLVAYVRG